MGRFEIWFERELDTIYIYTDRRMFRLEEIEELLNMVRIIEANTRYTVDITRDREEISGTRILVITTNELVKKGGVNIANMVLENI